MDPVAQMLFVLACLLMIGALGEWIFSRTGIPDVVWLVLAGILAGPVSGVVSPKLLSPAIPYFGAIALVIILSGGAHRLRLAEVAAAVPRAGLLAVVGFVFSVAGISFYLWATSELGFTRPGSFVTWSMIGAIVGGSSALVLMPTLATGRVDVQASRLIEVESSATDALSIVIAMVLLDFLVTGTTDLSRPFVSLAIQLGVGVALGVVTAAVLIPLTPSLRDKPHGYTVFLAAMLVLYALAELRDGNGAMAVLAAALILGNASTIVPKLIPGAHPDVFVETQTTAVMQDQMTFLIKSFFFVLIGLMFPTSPRLIAIGAVAAFALLLFRIPAVLLSTAGLGLSKRQISLVIIAVPRGLAAGVLSTLPLQYGLPNMENLSPAVFATIVTTILIFAAGFAVISRMPGNGEEIAPPGDAVI